MTANDAAIPPGCGDGVKTASEACDGADVGGATCSSAIAPGWIGVVSCTAACRINTAGCNTPATTWNPFNNASTDAANWATYKLGDAKPEARGFRSSVFDGRYLYLVPYQSVNNVASGVVARYDTQAGFGLSNSWQTFDVPGMLDNAAAKGFFGGAFDGRYVYFVPYASGNTAPHGNCVRYDTRGDFGQATSWTAFDMTTVDPYAVGYSTASFDGRYIYFAPYFRPPNTPQGVVARYDTQSDFADRSAWVTFDLIANDVDKNSNTAKGFTASTFDGRYLYLIPFYDGTAFHGHVARYDTKASGGFQSPDSWLVYNVATPQHPTAVGFYGATFDGRYVYLTQLHNPTVSGGLIVRYDTQQDFKTDTSWEYFDAASLTTGGLLCTTCVGFIGATFDGRYVYIAPHEHTSALQFDTTAPFSAPTSWSIHNIGSGSFQGANFDGANVYFIPTLSGSTAFGDVVQFRAKSPAWLPKRWNAAFD